MNKGLTLIKTIKTHTFIPSSLISSVGQKGGLLYPLKVKLSQGVVRLYFIAYATLPYFS